jgi:hypothetical protein
LFDGSTCWAERTITLCPRCGERLTLQSLHEQTLFAKTTVSGWLRGWPAVRQHLDRRISQASADDSQLAADQAETILAEFDWSLRQLSRLVAQLDQPCEAALGLSEDELMLTHG